MISRPPEWPVGRCGNSSKRRVDRQSLFRLRCLVLERFCSGGLDTGHPCVAIEPANQPLAIRSASAKLAAPCPCPRRPPCKSHAWQGQGGALSVVVVTQGSQWSASWCIHGTKSSLAESRARGECHGDSQEGGVPRKLWVLVGGDMIQGSNEKLDSSSGNIMYPCEQKDLVLYRCLLAHRLTSVIIQGESRDLPPIFYIL